MCEQYIRVVVETAHPSNGEDHFVVHAFKEEDHGRGMNLENVLARVIERCSIARRFRILAGVIAVLSLSGRSASSHDPTIVSAEEDLIIAARRLVSDWAECAAGDLDENDFDEVLIDDDDDDDFDDDFES